MKKVLCLSGFINNIDESYNNIKTNILNVSKYDVILFAWDYLINPLKNSNSPSIRDNRLHLNYLFKPKNFQIENFDSKYFIDLVSNISENEKEQCINQYIQYYGFYRANKMKKYIEYTSKFKYDKVIHLSLGSLLNNKLDLNNLNENNKCYLTDDYNLFISNGDNSNIFAEIFKEYEFYLNNNMESFTNEMIVKYHLEKNNLSVCNFAL